MMWTRFMDMHSGGGRKLEWDYILIEAPEVEAIAVFYSRFGRNPQRVTCTCCGDDYSINSEDSLARITAYDRGCRSVQQKRDPKSNLYLPLPEGVSYYLEDGEDPPEGYKTKDSYLPYLTVEQYVAKDEILVIAAGEIEDHERTGEAPEEGYVWQ